MTSHEARKRLHEYGPNQLQQTKRRSSWLILWDQFTNLIVALLVAAAVAAFAFDETVEGSAIVAVIFINAAIGFVTERRAVRSMEAIRELGHTDAAVRRDGAVSTMPARLIVPGDIIVLDAGDVLTADVRLVAASRLQADESPLTGESLPIDKRVDPVAEESALAERTSMMFKGTAVIRGSGEAVVVATGMATELGTTSLLVEQAEPEATPLEKRLDQLARRLIGLTLVIAAFVAVAVLVSGRGPFLAIEIGIALAVATGPKPESTPTSGYCGSPSPDPTLRVAPRSAMQPLLPLPAILCRLSATTLALGRRSTSSLLLMLALAVGLAAQDDLDNLPRPDGKSADMSKPVQVYILMGQSNMLGFGKPAGLADACKNKGLYPYLINEDGSWTVRKDVRYVRVMCSGSGPSKTHNNEWMTIKGNIGPEMGIGHYVGHVTDAPVLILKSCIGNRSLGYDLLPPNAEGYEGPSNPADRPKSGPWYAGVQYDGDVAAAKKVLKNLGKHYPGARRYQVAGFFFWQGDKDFRNADHAANYERNLLCLIESLRKDFDAPEARFVCATLGQTRKGAGGPQGKILEAQLNIDGERGKYRKHKGKVATVYSNPLSRGGSSSGHYGGNAETYQNIGEAMGKAMARMILAGPGAGVPGVQVGELDSSLKRVHSLLVAGKVSEAEKTLRPYLADTNRKKETHLAQARIMDEHLTGLVNDAIREMEELMRRKDFCGLRDALARTRKSYEGIPGYDVMLEVSTLELATEEAVAAMAIGDELAAIVAKKKRSNPSTYYASITGFLEKHPDSAYAEAARKEIAPIDEEIRALIAEVDKLGKRGDVYTQFEKIEEAEPAFAKIPSFDAANARWSAAAKDSAVRASIAAGEVYVGIFADIEKAAERLKKERAKSAGKSPKAKAKAHERALAKYHKKLATLAKNLQKLGEKLGNTYYGRAAIRSYQTFEASDGKSITDRREK